MPNLPLVPGVLPYNCYPADPRTLINDAFELAVAVQNTTLTGVILQDATPAVADQDKVWARTSGGAPVFPFLWKFQNGQWVARHPIPSAVGWAYLFTGASTAITNLDRGAGDGTGSTISDNSGPFWEIDAAFAARLPVGVGTLPVTNSVLASGDTGGLEQADITIAKANLPSVPLDIALHPNIHTFDTIPAGTGYFAGDAANVYWTSSGSSTRGGHTRNLGDGAAITLNRMPPYKTVYFLKRTARIWCTQPIT